MRSATDLALLRRTRHTGRRGYHLPHPNLPQARWWHRRDIPRRGARLRPRVRVEGFRRAGVACQNCSLVALVRDMEGVGSAATARLGAVVGVLNCVWRFGDLQVVIHGRRNLCSNKTIARESETNADRLGQGRRRKGGGVGASCARRDGVHWLVQAGRSGAPACCSSCSSACGCEGDASLCLQVPVPVPVPDTQRVLS